MKKLISISILLFALGACNSTKNEKEVPSEFHRKEVLDYVNPFIGTGGHGHTFPGTTVPFGMVQLSPDSRLDGWDGCSGYHYTDSIIYGFSHTHLSGTGVGDYGDVLLTPYSGNPISYTDALERKTAPSLFQKTNEKASPGYYKVKLDNHDVSVQLTSTERVGIHNYNFNSDQKNILIDLRHRDMLLDYDLEVINDTLILGKRISKAWANEQHCYFALTSNRPFISSLLVSEEEIAKKDQFLNLAFKADNVQIKVALSTTSTEGALLNLKGEATHWDFDRYHNRAKKLWKGELSKIEFHSSDESILTNFYSALYHTMIAPNLISDVDGKYRGHDKKIHQSDHDVHTVFSLWDTFRATHPLYTIIDQKRTKKFINHFINIYNQSGRLPVWELSANETDCMIGYHSVSVIWDAVSKGVEIDDKEKALEAMVASANEDHFGLSYYKKNGFIGASQEAESVSKTLEYAYDDWCISKMAEHLGNSDVSSNFRSRAYNYQNVFDPETRFFRARRNGGWFTPFDPAEVNFNYTEANAWQYSLFAPQNIPHHIQIMGGKDIFKSHLDDLFTVESETTGRHQADITGLIGQYAHGNEPSHHMAYLYNYINEYESTQTRIRQILAEQYSNAPDGLSGNEDCGQMSAWYVLSSMGLYSVTPGMPRYDIGVCIADSVIINLENGNKFKIIGRNDKELISSVTYNGNEIEYPFILHEEIMQGGELAFHSGAEAKKFHDLKMEDQEAPLASPYFKTKSMVFKGSLLVEAGTIDDGIIEMSIDGGDFHEVDQVQLIQSAHVTIRTYSFENTIKTYSRSVDASFVKHNSSLKLEELSEYANQYSAGGKEALIDALRGGPNYRTGQWQGFEGSDVEAVVDLGNNQMVNTITIGALQDIKSWIWYPEIFKVYVSENGVDFNLAGEISNSFPIDSYGAFVNDFKIEIGQNAQKIKIEAINRGKCPEWHLGAGGTSWIFLDEIIID